MPQVEQPPRRTKKHVAVGVVALVVLVAVIAAVASLLHVSPTPPPPTTDSVLKQAENYSFSNNYSQAIVVLNKQLSYAKTNDEKASLYSAMSAAYANEGDKSAALQAAEKADSLVPGFDSSLAVARLAAANGDKAKALDIYNKDQLLITSGKDHLHAYELQDIQTAISQLQGGSQ